LAVDLQPWQIGFGAAAALLFGFAKTGVPGAGILAIPVMAKIFGGRLSVGATLPLLVFADIFAVAFYRAHAEWDHLKKLTPWVLAGLLIGTWTLKALGDAHTATDLLNPIIGWIVLAMLVVSLLRSKLGDRLVPTSKEGVIATGALAGFTTMVANAAGPIMQIYMVATGMAKNKLMGTTAWYFFIFNLTKVPLLILVTLDNPGEPMYNAQTIHFDLAMLPFILVGALLGRWLLPMIPQKAFNNVILVLTALACVKLIGGF